MARLTASSASTVAPGAWRNISLVAQRELASRLRSKSFLITTIVLLLLVVGGAGAISLASDNGPSKVTIGLTPAAADLAEPLRATGTSMNLKVTTVDVAADQIAATISGDSPASVVLDRADGHVTAWSETGLSTQLSPLINAVTQQDVLTRAIKDLGGDPDKLSADLAKAAPVQQTVKEARDGGKIFAGVLAGILLFIGIQTAGQLLAQGIVEEKTSRVVELLLATMRPWHLMVGKVVGIGIVGLSQVVVLVGGAAGAAIGFGLLDSSTLDLGATVWWTLLWFVIGYASYAVLLAGLAALVSRQEDVGSVVMPVIMIMIVPYMIAVSVAPQDPGAAIITWGSFIPLAAPLLMPVRIAMGEASVVQALASAAISIAVLPGLALAAGRIYGNAVLRSGSKVKVRDAWRAS